MSQGIVIGRTPDESGALWTEGLLQSLEGGCWPVEVHQTWDFELATISWAAERFDEFVFLPASTIVKDLALFDLAFGDLAGKSINLGGVQGGNRFRMYLGKYLGASVRALGVPAVSSKWDAVMLEDSWCETYAQIEQRADRLVSLGGPLDHTEVFEERHGRMNMVVQNEFLIRFKGTWDARQISR